MPDTTRAEKLLSLFTSADHAAAIAGDLTEQRGHRGPFLFWLDVTRVMIALWRGSLVAAPAGVLMLALAGCALLMGPVLVGSAAIMLFPASVASPVNWIALSLIWSAGAAWTGASLVHMAVGRGMAACVALATVGQVLLIALITRTPRPELPTVPLVLLYTTMLAAPAILLLGGAIARRRIVLRDVASGEAAS